MAGRIAHLIAVAAQRRSLLRWRAAAMAADRLDAGSLLTLGSQARALRSELDLVLAKAEGRGRRGAAPINRPGGTDWAWRPEPWSAQIRPAAYAPVPRSQALSRDTKIFHDCDLGEIAVRQTSGRRGTTAQQRVSLDVFGFAGSYLSLVVTLPEEAMAGLSRRHILRLEAQIAAERALRIYARLNIRHGPNTEQIPREMDLRTDLTRVEFDLGHAAFVEGRVERAWIDLFFEEPAMNRVVISDLTVSRGMRAEY